MEIKKAPALACANANRCISIIPDGWQKVNSGFYMSGNHAQSYDKWFQLFIRKRPLNEVLPKKKNDLSKIKSLAAVRSEKDSLLIGFDSEWVSHEGCGERTKEDMLSWQFAVVDGQDLLEFVWLHTSNRLLNLEYVIGFILDYLGSFHAYAAKTLTAYAYVTEWNRRKNCPKKVLITKSRKEAMENAKYAYNLTTHKFEQDRIDAKPGFQEGKPIPQKYRNWDYYHAFCDCRKKKRIPITIICHTGRVDLSTLDHSNPGNCDILRHCTSVQGGTITLQPTAIQPKAHVKDYVDSRNIMLYPVSLSVADTMCHAPAGKKSLADLGKAVGVPKVILPKEPVNYIAHMDQLLQENPGLYLNYAGNDAVVALLYASSIYGFNKQVPATLTSAGANTMKGEMMNTLDTKTIDDFNRKYRGLQKVRHGLVETENRPGYLEATSLEPISEEAEEVQRYAVRAYHGGYNSSSMIGLYNQTVTYDFDLRNAYATALSAVPDVDWEDPILTRINNEDLSLKYWKPWEYGYKTLQMMICNVSFEFPKTVKYPCIMVMKDGVPFYPRTSEGLKDVYVFGPELYLALRLGAKIHCKKGMVLNYREVFRKGKTESSKSARDAVHQLVEDRDLAKEEYGKDSLEEQVLKTMVNAGYGKIAQGVVDKKSWSAMTDEMQILSISGITNPVIAGMATSIVRATLLAAQNQIEKSGHHTYSVTTDGFITDIDFPTLKTMDLYGFRYDLSRVRYELTDGMDGEIWQLKHMQDDLLNFTTRGNVSLHTDGFTMVDPDGDDFEGVCAHNSAKSGFLLDSLEDRKWLYKAVLSRTGTVDYEDTQWSGFKELTKGQNFRIDNVTRHIRMDFDMKRKPDRKSFYSVTATLDGETYEIANFDTKPFEDVEEFDLYRKKKKLVQCLRTMEDWKYFWAKIDLKDNNAKPRDLEWAILMSCIMGYRAGRFDIPALSAKYKSGVSILAPSDRFVWINQHNTSDKQFTTDDWTNCGRKERWNSILPDELIHDKLKEMQGDWSWMPDNQ